MGEVEPLPDSVQHATPYQLLNTLCGRCFIEPAGTVVYPVATVTTSRNGVFGFFLNGSSFLTTLPGGGSKFVMENNGIGIFLRQGAGAVFFEGGRLTVKNNGVGLSADGAGVVTVISDAGSPSSISGNGLDVDLKFGTRATLDGVTVGSIVCDSTVLSRGTTVCP